MLSAHILDLCKLQRAVALGLGQSLAGDVGVDMDLEGLVVLADNKTVADAGEVGAQRREIDVGLVLSDDEHRVECIGDLLGAENIECAVLVCDSSNLNGGLGSRDLAAQIGQHSPEDDYVALASGVDNSGFPEHGVEVDGIFKGFFAYSEGGLEHLLDVAALLCIFHRGCGGHARDGQYRTFGGLHDRLVGRVDAVLHSGGKFLCADGLHALEPAGNSAKEQGQDYAGVSARTAQQRTGDAVGHRINGVKLLFSELSCRRVQGKTHICARIAVGNGENIQFVYLLGIRCKRCVRTQYHIFKRRGVNVFSQSKSTSGRDFLYYPMITVSTKTSTLLTGTPVALATL